MISGAILWLDGMILPDRSIDAGDCRHFIITAAPELVTRYSASYRAKHVEISFAARSSTMAKYVDFLPRIYVIYDATPLSRLRHLICSFSLKSSLAASSTRAASLRLGYILKMPGTAAAFVNRRHGRPPAIPALADEFSFRLWRRMPSPP